MKVLYQVSSPVTNEELNALFAVSWPAHIETDFQAVLRHSLLYICAYLDTTLVGFVNVAWDGGVHGFLLDPTVHPDHQRKGIGLQLVHEAIAQAQAKGIQWLHVDYEPHLARFYVQCGFQHTEAGLIRLNEK